MMATTITATTMTATNHGDQLGEIYPTVLNELNCTFVVSFYRAMHFSAFARSWDRMSSVCLSVCNVGDL